MYEQLYRVRDAADGALIMIAPMHTITRMFNLQREAVARVQTETASDPACSLVHFNGRNRYYAGISVSRATFQIHQGDIIGESQ